MVPGECGYERGVVMHPHANVSSGNWPRKAGIPSCYPQQTVASWAALVFSWLRRGVSKRCARSEQRSAQKGGCGNVAMFDLRSGEGLPLKNEGADEGAEEDANEEIAIVVHGKLRASCEYNTRVGGKGRG